MAAGAQTGCVFFKEVQMPLWGGRVWRRWGRIWEVFLEILQFVLANRCCRLSQQQRKKPMLDSDSIHSSPKLKLPSSEVITHGAL